MRNSTMKRSPAFLSAISLSLFTNSATRSPPGSCWCSSLLRMVGSAAIMARRCSCTEHTLAFPSTSRRSSSGPSLQSHRSRTRCPCISHTGPASWVQLPFYTPESSSPRRCAPVSPTGDANWVKHLANRSSAIITHKTLPRSEHHIPSTPCGISIRSPHLHATDKT